MMNNAVKDFDILAISLNVPNYFDGLKLFLDLYLAKFLHTLTKHFFRVKKKNEHYLCHIK